MLKNLLAIGLLFLAIKPAFAQVAGDVAVSVNRPTASTSIQTAAFSTTSGNELLLAFVSTDYLSGANTTVTGVSGAGLT
jgi:hypothetical protein